MQRLLNDVRVRGGLPKLVVDGLVGPKTIGAIDLYQRSKGFVTDGRADVSGKTIKGLMADHVAGLMGGTINGSLSTQGQNSPLNTQMMNDAMDEYWQALKK